MFKVGDLVYVSNLDTKYEEENGVRDHKNFFGIVTDFTNEGCVDVKFPQTPNGCEIEWAYNENELSLASELKDLTIDELEKKFGLQVFAEYLM